MNERIKELRKALGLTMEKFGVRLGVGKTAIHKLEKGENNVTDQMAKSICREFGVDPYWLETGEGQMFLQSDDAFMEKLDTIMAGENDLHKNIIRLAANLAPEELAVIEKMIHNFVEQNKEEH